MALPRPKARRAVTLLVTATVATSSVALTAPAIASAQSGCGATFNLFIPGTWETTEDADPSVPVGMLKPVADALKTAHGSDAEIYTLPYMARAFDNGHTYADSKADALAKSRQVLSKIENDCPRAKFTIVGYSQGADAAGDLASEIGNGKGPVDAGRVLVPERKALRRSARTLRAAASPTRAHWGWGRSLAASPRSALRETCTARSRRARAPYSVHSARS